MKSGFTTISQSQTTVQAVGKIGGFCTKEINNWCKDSLELVFGFIIAKGLFLIDYLPKGHKFNGKYYAYILGQP